MRCLRRAGWGLGSKAHDDDAEPWMCFGSLCIAGVSVHFAGHCGGPALRGLGFPPISSGMSCDGPEHGSI